MKHQAGIDLRGDALSLLCALLLGPGALAFLGCGGGDSESRVEEAVEEAQDEAEDAKEELEDEMDDRM